MFRRTAEFGLFTVVRRPPTLEEASKRKRKHAMKKVKKPAPAKWGTMEWIKANPWLSMDRKRRKRAERVVGEEAVKRLRDRVHVCCLTLSLEDIMDGYRIELSKSEQNRVEAALVTLARFEDFLYNEAFARELVKAWGLLDEKKGGVAA